MKSLNSIKLFSLIILFAISCNSDSENGNSDIAAENIPEKSKIEIVQERIEQSLQSQLNDPSTYEFIDLVPVDSVTYKDNIETRIRMFNRSLDSYKNSLERQEGFRAEGSSLFNESAYNRAKTGFERYTKYIEGIKEIENDLGQSVNDIAAYKYVIRFRAANAFGALTVNDYFVQIAPKPDYRVLNIVAERGQLHSAPNGFPGYTEMINRYN